MSEIIHIKEQEFVSKQAQSMDSELKRCLDEQKEERKLLELRFLDGQQDLKRSELDHFNLSVLASVVFPLWQQVT